MLHNGRIISLSWFFMAPGSSDLPQSPAYIPKCENCWRNCGILSGLSKSIERRPIRGLKSPGSTERSRRYSLNSDTSLVELLQCCVLIGRELQMVEIFSKWLYASYVPRRSKQITSQWDELVLYGIRLLAQATLWSSRPMVVENTDLV